MPSIEPAEPQASRAELLGQLATLEREAAQAADDLRTLLADQETRCGREKAAYLDSLRVLQGLRAQGALDSGHLHVERGALQRRLESLADPRIDDALRRLETALTNVRARPRLESNRLSDRIRSTSLKPLMRPVSNQRAFTRLTEAAVAARRELEALKYCDVGDLPATIAAIEATIPWHDVETLEFDDEPVPPGRTWQGDSAA